jgi:signal transduction histidine kinase
MNMSVPQRETKMTTLVSDAPMVPVIPAAQAADTHATGGAARLGVMLLALLAVGAAAAAIVVAGSPNPLEWIGAVLVGLWTVAGMALHRRGERLGPLVLVGAVLGGAALLTEVLARETTSVVVDAGLRLSLALLPAVAFHILMSLPGRGRLVAGRRPAVVAGYVLGALTGLAMMSNRDSVAMIPLLVLWGLALGIGLYLSNASYQTAGAVDRRRMQWIGWALAVWAEVTVVVLALNVLARWPDDVGLIVLAVTGLVPLAIIAGTVGRLVMRVDRLLTYTVAMAGVTTLVVAVYLLVVIGLGRRPEGEERSLLLLSMVAAGVAALLYVPARHWLAERANRLVYGERTAPDETLRTFGQRLSRAIPLDELLLQLAESLRKSLLVEAAEVWTGRDGRFELAAGVPHREADALTVGAKEQAVVARAGVSGGTWIDIWLPGLSRFAGPHGTAGLRVAPIAHHGELLGLIVCRRRRDGEPFTEREDAVLAELGRQVGLALHNVQLDSALQASLEELQASNEELQRSRARIVAAGDAERRKLERNLHDGAQQHLVALAVKLRLAQDAVEDDPADAVAMLDELKGDLQGAIQELRALAHGIFPPLLVSGGLPEALRAAATRSPLPVDLEVDGTGRYSSDLEAAVYFCCVEALQNAAKHAGDSATVRVEVAERDGALTFAVVDDGAGFDAGTSAMEGHGFVNMSDRLGAFGGTLTVSSRPGEGTGVTGRVPL